MILLISNLLARVKTDLVKRKRSIDEKIPPNSFLDHARPIFIVLRLFGRLPCGISKNEIKPFSKTSSIAVYSFLLLIISMYAGGKVLEVLTKKLATSESYKDSLKSFMLISFLIHYPLIPLTDWLLVPTLIKYITIWHRYECQFNEEFVKFPNNYLIPFLSYCTWPFAIYFAYFSAYEMCGNSFLHSMIFVPLIQGLAQYVLLWFLCQTFLVMQIRKLKETVTLEGLQKRVERTRKCWLLLSELASSTGYAIGVVLTSVGMTAFVAFIINCYIFFTSFLEPEGCAEWEIFMMVAFPLLVFFFIFDSAERTTKEVGRYFYSAVFDQKFSQLDEENLNQLVLLLTTFRLHPPTVWFAGLLEANRNLFVSFMRNSLTYLIVLVQSKTE